MYWVLETLLSSTFGIRIWPSEEPGVLCLLLHDNNSPQFLVLIIQYPRSYAISSLYHSQAYDRPEPFNLCILVILLRQSAGLNANYSSAPKMERLLNISRKVFSSLVLALRFPNIVIHFRMSSAASCLPFHLNIVVINLRQYEWSTIYSGIPKPKHFPNITRKIPNNLTLV